MHTLAHFSRLLSRGPGLLLAALSVTGHTAAGVFLTNNRLIGIEESKAKAAILLGHLFAWPLAGIASSWKNTSLEDWLGIPLSWGRAWRMLFALIGARWLVQEAHRYLHPAPAPREVLSTSTRLVDMRDEIFRAEGISTEGLRGALKRANESYLLEIIIHEVRLERLPVRFDGLRLLHISDIHYGPFASAEYIRRCVEAALALSPDIVALTGDFQTYPEDIEKAAELLRPIGEWSRHERAGSCAFAITGNHDREAGKAHVIDALRRAGICVLGNEHFALERDGARLFLAGVSDPWSLKANLALALDGIPDGSCVILMAHVPDFIVEAARDSIDLQLSGHNHGGQIKVPLLGTILVSSRYSRRYAEGFYKLQNTLMYVSRGLGGKPPIRLGSKPEITLLVLRSGQVSSQRN